MENTATGSQRQAGSQEPEFTTVKFHAIRDVNMSIRENKVTALHRSAVGCVSKSTLLRTFNRMSELYLRASAPADPARRRKPVDVQDRYFADSLLSVAWCSEAHAASTSIYDNIAFGVRLFERACAA